ncbi:MAG TPA: ABC transporter permease, partial [Puia sp.]|nr:ABC transporter permease [Puia sp.]
MVKYYFKIFLRNFSKNKSHFLLNLLGLTLGITCFLFALLFVFYETNYDSYVLHKDRIARIVTTVRSGGNETHTAYAMTGLSGALTKAFPEIERMARFYPYDGRVAAKVTGTDNAISLENLYYTDSAVFDMFSYPLLSGDRKTCLNGPNTIVLGRKVAKKLFGTVSPLNQTIVLNKKLLKVTGVVQDLPGNSDLVFDALISWDTLTTPAHEDWSYLYAMFRTPKARDSFQSKLDKYTKETINPEIAREADISFRLQLEPMGSIHFSNNSVFDTPKGDKKFVNIFLITGMLILLIACTNSVNMMVVRSFSRATETTIQKIYGARRSALVIQQMLESMLTGLIAAILSFFIIWMLLPEYAVTIDRRLSTPDLFNWKMVGAVFSALLILGISGAVYTGFFLQKVSLSDIIRSGTSRGYQMKWVPRLMLGFQFFISMAMMVAALVVHRQVKYMKDAPLGFNPANVLVVELPQGKTADEGGKYLKNVMGEEPGVLKTSLAGSNTLPGASSDKEFFEYIENGVVVKKMVDDASVDADYLALLQIPIVKGENFHAPRRGKTSNEVIVTEMFAKRAGWKGNEAIGKRMSLIGDEEHPSEVIGVVPDFHFSSLHNPITPMAIIQDPGDPAYLLVRTEAAKTVTVLDRIGKEWKRTFSGLPFYYYYLDQHLAKQYRGDDELVALLLTLTSLIILISCIGLVAYTSFIMRLASANIAIRRIVGASLKNIFYLFNRQFTIILAIAFLMTLPIAWY